MSPENNHERDLRLLKQDLEKSLRTKNGRPVSTALVYNLKKRWGLSEEDATGLMAELGYENKGQTWDKIEQIIPASTIEIHPPAPTRIYIPGSQPPRKSISTNYNSDGTLIEFE